MAGVMIASPKKKEAPMIPKNNGSPPFFLKRLSISTTSERMPPSPRLSARIITKTYLMVTMVMTDQTKSDTTPKTAERTSPPALTIG
jgi:hypothetical protein